MAEPKRVTEREWHRKMAAKEFNLVWSLLEKKHRTSEQDLEMIHAAHASRYHWGILGKPVNRAIGEWQVSHVYVVLRMPEPSWYHAERCLEVCRKSRLGGFPLAFAYEALARAASVAGDARARDRYLVQAEKAGARIRDAEDRALLLSDLRSIPHRRARKPSR